VLDRLIEPFIATRRLIENRVPTLMVVLWVSWTLARAHDVAEDRQTDLGFLHRIES
jgi:hypothetical protein